MKSAILFFAAFLFFNSLFSQTMRYFEVVGLGLPANEWRDSAYVVAASDPALLAEIEYELTRPMEERRHINGPIAGGNGGFNRNGSFWFSWHTQPDKWMFADFSIELCDGRVYSDVETDTAYWIGVVERFCGWSYRVMREVSAPVSVPEPIGPIAGFQPVLPNPASDEVRFSWTQQTDAEAVLQVTNLLGGPSMTLYADRPGAGRHTKSWPTATLPTGVYCAMLRVGKTILTQRFVIVH